MAIVVAVGLISLVFSVLLAMFDILGVEEWSVENFVISRSYQITHALLVWKTENFQNASVAIEDKYATDITAGTIMRATACTAMTLAGVLQDFVIQDLMLFSSLTILSETKSVIGFLQKSGESSNIRYAEVEHPWKKCINLKALSDSGNTVLGVTLKILHVKYLFTFTFLLLGWLNNDEIKLFNSVVALNSLKIIFFYWIGVQTSENVNHISNISVLVHDRHNDA